MNTAPVTLKRVAVITGLFLGAFALAALADWVAPTFTPPTCPSTVPGCNPPINTGATAQTKTGGLMIGAVTPATTAGQLGVSGNASIGGLLGVGSFKMPTGAGVNKVLTSDVAGNGTWQNPTTGSSYSAGTGISISGSNQISNTGVTGITAASGISVSQNTGNVSVGTHGLIRINENSVTGSYNSGSNTSLGTHTYCALAAEDNTTNSGASTFSVRPSSNSTTVTNGNLTSTDIVWNFYYYNSGGHAYFGTVANCFDLISGT